jgi:hypothetical protein
MAQLLQSLGFLFLTPVAVVEVQILAHLLQLEVQAVQVVVALAVTVLLLVML